MLSKFLNCWCYVSFQTRKKERKKKIKTEKKINLFEDSSGNIFYCISAAFCMNIAGLCVFAFASNFFSKSSNDFPFSQKMMELA